MAFNCSEALVASTLALDALNASYQELQVLYEEASAPPEDPCAYESPDKFTLSFHIGGVFAVLFASAIGAALPLFSSLVPKFAVPPFLIVLGKCVGTGVILACALIHMLLPANESLTSECLPTKFTEDYEAYAYLFAMLAGLGMHFLDDLLAGCVRARYATKGAPAVVDGHSTGGGTTAAATAGGDAPPVLVLRSPDAAEATQPGVSAKAPPGAVEYDSTRHTHAAAPPSPYTGDLLLASIVHVHAGGSCASEHKADGGPVGHAKLVVAALMMEFGVSVHSVLIGIAVGVLSDDKLSALLVALCFHQFFEGVALGSRLVDAAFPSRLFEASLSTIFAVSAPVGMAVGVGLVFSGTLNPSSTTYLFTQGTLDGVCAGILLYLGYALLTHDFPEDAANHCGEASVVSNSPGGWRRRAMFVALWIGAGLMAFLGKYL